MMMGRSGRGFAFVMLISMSSAASAAVVNYDDVAVIVNTNSTTSKAIGAYFQTARSIPAANMIYVSVPEQEIIDDATFGSLRSQIETYLTSHNLSSAINYLVTTKGVPLKVNRESGGGDPFSTSSASASVESELTLILGSYSDYIGGAGRVISPYYNASQHFSKDAYGMYLVTRLDGYSLQDVLNLIDRAHPGLAPDNTSLFVLDEDPAWNATVPSLNMYLADAATALTKAGKAVRLNSDSVYVTGSSDVLGYTSWGSNDHHASEFTQYARPHNAWAPGAIAETYVSTSARSFASPPVYGQSLIADLVSEGVSGAKGYVYEPFSSAMAISSILFSDYAAGYNLAESYYQSSVYLSWMDVVIGDPKTSIDGSSPAPLPIQLSSLSATVDVPTATVSIHWTTQSEIHNYGFTVQRRQVPDSLFIDLDGSFTPGAQNSVSVHQYAYSDHPARIGTYQYRLRQTDLDGTQHYSEAVEVTVSSITAVQDRTGESDQFRLEQNYPNPFNPTTVISGQWTADSRVRLVVYDLCGQEVAVLADGRFAAGKYSFRFDGSKYASGKYIYRLTAGHYSASRTMTLLK